MSKTVVVPIDASIVVEEQTIPEPLRRARPLPAPVASAAQTFGVEVLDKPIDVASDAAEAFVAPSEQLTHERAAEFVRDLCGRGHYAQAAELLARDLHDHGSHPNDWCRVALLLVDGGRPADALNVVNSVLLGAPGFGPALAVKAHALLALGSPAHNQEALQLTESFPADRDPVMITASVCALALNDRVDEAQALLDTSRDLGSESVRASRLRFVIAVRTGNEAGALRWATAVADDEPFNALAQVRAAAPGSYGGFANLPRCGRSVRVVLRCTWRSLSQLDRTLPERAGRLLGAFDLAPQSQSAMRAVRRIGPTDPWYIVHNALATLLIVYGVNYAAFRLFSSVVALSVGIALAIIAIVRVGATVHASRGIPRELRAWRRYANDLSHTRYFRNFGRSPRHRQVRPPTNSVFGSAATCRCSKLNFLDGDSAVKYAWLHLAPRATSVETPTIKEFICPTTLVRWLGFQNTPSSPEVPQLCRLDSGLTDLYDDTTPTCA